MRGIAVIIAVIMVCFKKGRSKLRYADDRIFAIAHVL